MKLELNLENVKTVVRFLRTIRHDTLFSALILNEKIDYLQELEDLTEKDIEFLKELYEEYIEDDTITGLLDIQRLVDKYSEIED